MAIWVIDPEAVLAFRRNHRRETCRQRNIKRNKQMAKPRDRNLDKTDRDWLNAIERDKAA